MQSLILTFLFSTFFLFSAVAQERQSATQLDEVQQELQRLRAQLDSLRDVSALSRRDEVDMASFEREMDGRLRELENKIDAVARSTAPTIFNPRTTAFLNFAARADNQSVMDEEDVARIDNRPFLRSIELDFRGAVDPYAEAVIILAIEDEAGTGFAIDPEEAYGLIKKMPFLESAPLGLKTKVGKFRAPFGTNNRLHMHDLPWTTRPLAISKYLGTEHGDFFESGYNPVGVDFDFFLPFLRGTTLEMNLDIVKAGEMGFAKENPGKQPAVLSRLTLSADWKNEHILAFGLSGYNERGTNSTSLIGADVTYKWTPAQRGASRSFVAGGEILAGEHSFLDPVDGRTTMHPLGWFAYMQYQFSYGTYGGLRYDWVREPDDADEITQAISAYLSYYTTEFLRFRLGLDHRVSDVPSVNGRTTLTFEINFVFGSHPVEPYWVTR